MSRAKARRPSRRLRLSKKNRTVSYSEGGIRPQRVSAQKIRLARNTFEPARCGYSGQTSTGNNTDDGNDGGNNDERRTGSKAGNRTDNKVWRNTSTENSTRKGNIRSSPDRTRY